MQGTNHSDFDKENHLITTSHKPTQSLSKREPVKPLAPHPSPLQFDMDSLFFPPAPPPDCFAPSLYLNKHSEITPKMREVLIEWLHQVHYKFKLQSETLFLSINLLDRYLSTSGCSMHKLQLVGVVSLWLASKFEEVCYLDIKELLYLTSDTYTTAQAYELEIDILKRLEYRIWMCTSYRLAMIECFRRSCNRKQESLVEFLLEMCFMEYRMLRFSNYTVARAAVFVMEKIEKVEKCGESNFEVKSCVKEIVKLITACKNVRFQTIRQKFLKKEYCCVAALV